MTVLNLETVVLRGVRALQGNVTRLVSMASKVAGTGASMVVSSRKRHLSSKPAQAEADRGPRYNAMFGGTAVPRAGRLADLGGVLVSRHPSNKRWPRPTRQATGRICPPWLTHMGPTAKRLPTGILPGGRGMQAMLRAR